MLNTGSEKSPLTGGLDSGRLPPPAAQFEQSREAFGAIRALALLGRAPTDEQIVSSELLRPLVTFIAANPRKRIERVLTRVRDAAPGLWPEIASRLQSDIAEVLSPLDKALQVPVVTSAFARLNAVRPEFLTFAERQIASPMVHHHSTALVECGELLLHASITTHRIHGTLLRALGAEVNFQQDRSGSERYRVKSYGIALPDLSPSIIGGLLRGEPRGLGDLSCRELLEVSVELGRINVRRREITRTIEARMDEVVAELTPDERAKLCRCTNLLRGYSPEKLWRLVGAGRNGWSLAVSSFEAHSDIISGLARDPEPILRSPYQYAILRDLTRSAIHHVSEASARQSAKIIAALGVLRHNDQPLLVMCSDRLLQGIDSLEPMQLLPVLRGMTELLFHHPLATPAIIAKVAASVNSLRPKQRAELFCCMAKLNELDSPAGKRVLGALSRMIAELPTKDAVKVAWSAGVLPAEQGSEVWNAAVKTAMQNQKEIQRDDWIAIYEGCLATGNQCPSSLAQIVSPLLQFREQSYKPRSHFQREVAAVLESLNLEFEEEVWVRPYRVDFRVFKPDGTETLLEVDGVQFHFVAGDIKRPFGRHIIKDKVLANLGHEILHIRSDEWGARSDNQRLLKARLGIEQNNLPPQAA